MAGYKGRAIRSDLDLSHGYADQLETDNNRGPWSENLANCNYHIYHFIRLRVNKSGKQRLVARRAVTDIVRRPAGPVNA